MSDTIYNWKRFWYPRGEKVNLSDDGYLYNQNSKWGQSYNTNVVISEVLSKIPCLVLLGEPGIGKSYALEKEYNNSYSRFIEEGNDSLYINLNSCESSDIHDVFENKEFKQWEKSDYKLYLFFDSLDEGMLNIRTLATLLKKMFSMYANNIERFYIRIACRTAEWQYSGLEDTLKKLWKEENMKIYEMAPLRKLDVIEAANVNGLNTNEFMKEIVKMRAVPFAIKPVTLKFLIDIYKRDRCFPSKQSELYYEGCKLLCNENNIDRFSAGYTGVLESEQRLAVAERIAAISVFTNKSAVFTGISPVGGEAQDINISDLCGEKETEHGNDFKVGEKEIRDTLSTGLFRSYGQERMGWAHRTYAEFLAAHYLIRHDMPFAQRISLILHPMDYEGKVIPNLYETAAWIANMDIEVFRYIIKIDAEVLMRSDVITAEEYDKAALVEALLKLFDEEKIIDDWDKRTNYEKLNHARLVEQLSPYINDNCKNIIVRRAAVDIAEACELNELEDDIANLALDDSQPLPIRKNAAYAIARIGSEKSKCRLKTLIQNNSFKDPDDELKGCALKALWPNFLTPEELFNVLTIPKRNNFIGAYQSFILHELANYIESSNLPIALQWAKNNISEDISSHSFQNLVNTINSIAWRYLESPNVLKAFADVVVSYIKSYKVGESLKKAFADNEKKRREVLENVVLIFSDDKDSIANYYCINELVTSNDFWWIIERLRKSDNIKANRIWTNILEWIFNREDVQQIDAIFIESRVQPAIAEKFAWMLKPVELSSPEAEKMKQSYRHQQELLEKRKGRSQRKLLDPPPIQRVNMLLDKFESGELDSWWQLNMEMTLEPDSTHYRNELESDLTTLPVWKTADETMKNRIIEAAEKYLFEKELETSQRIIDSTIYRPAFAGYRAFQLLLKESQQTILNIPEYVWKRWAPTILSYPISSGIDDESAHSYLVKIAYNYAPDEIIHTLEIIIDNENKAHDHIFIIRKVENCWNDKLASVIMDKVKDDKIKPSNMGCLLSLLLEHNMSIAKEYAENIIALNPNSNSEQFDKAVIVASTLMAQSEDTGWEIIWPIIKQNAEFGRKVITKVAHNRERVKGNVYSKLSEYQLAELYIWIEKQYPYSEDPEYEDAYWVGPRDSIAEFRNGILNYLKISGTKQSCDAIEKIARTFPNYEWMKWILIEARKIKSQCTWLPPKAEDIIKMALDSKTHLVQNGEQLLDILVESLKRLELKLQGETPAAVFLWDEWNSKFKPKNENRFSDFVKQHLEEDLKQKGVIVNREVEIRSRIGDAGKSGERTDIHVDAFINGQPNDVLTVIIEVKGCWNRGLNEAMETQLVNRYLKDNSTQHGLYLIGWFNCSQWDSSDYRKRYSLNKNIEDVRQQFDEQAVKLSQKGIHVKAFVMNAALR